MEDIMARQRPVNRCPSRRGALLADTIPATGKSKTEISALLSIPRQQLCDALDVATKAEDMNIPGFNYHQLTGFNPTRYTVHVNGPWCITFEFSNGNAYDVDFEQYH